MNLRLTLLLTFFVIINTQIFAQSEVAKVADEKPVGPWTIGGNFRFVSTNTGNFNYFSFISEVDKSNYLSVNPVLSYGFTNRTSGNLFLGFGGGKQSGKGFVFDGNPGQFISKSISQKIKNYSIGVSVDHYFILKDFFGLRLELGTLVGKNNSTLRENQVQFADITIASRITMGESQFVNVFFGPNIDFFIGQRINVALNMGNIGYTVTKDKLNPDAENTKRFESTLSPDNIGLGLEFNF